MKFGWLGMFVLDERRPSNRPDEVSNSYKLLMEGVLKTRPLRPFGRGGFCVII